MSTKFNPRHQQGQNFNRQDRRDGEERPQGPRDRTQGQGYGQGRRVQGDQMPGGTFHAEVDQRAADPLGTRLIVTSYQYSELHFRFPISDFEFV